LATTNKITKILLFSGTYPSKDNLQLGSFVKESVDTFKKIRDIKFYLAVSKHLPFNPLLVFIKYLRLNIIAIYKIIIYRPQLIIAHSLFPTGVFSLIIAKIFNIKLVVFAHGGDIMGLSKSSAILWEKDKMNMLWKVRYKLISQVVHKSNGVIYVSNYLFDLAEKHFQACKNNSLISPIGYNPEFFSLTEKYIERKNVILYVGRIDEKKGIYNFLNILNNISGYLNDNKFKILIIGRVDEDKFHNILKEYKARLNIDYLGEKDRIELGKYYNSSLLTIVPSHFEGFGLVAVESLACATPVACFPVGGLNEIVKDNYNGINLDINNNIESGNRLKILLSNRKKLIQLSSNSIKSIEGYKIKNTHSNNLNFIDKIYNT